MASKKKDTASYEVTFDNVGNWYRGEVVTADQAGEHLERWVSIGALTKVVPLGDPADDEPTTDPETEEVLPEVTTPPPVVVETED